MKLQSDILQHLHLVGISHWNTPVDIREQFSLSQEQMVKLYADAKAQGVDSIFAISTCNRTEIYAITESTEQLTKLFAKNTFPLPSGEGQLSGLPESRVRSLGEHESLINQYAYHKTSNDALQHLLKVATGLDAQIVGDAQITGQIREFHQLAVQHNALDAVLNRLIESAIAAGKKVKADAQFGMGAFSVAHAAVNYAVKQKRKKQFRALVVGAGKTGKLTLQSSLKVIAAENITVVNRTDANAFEAAKQLGVTAANYSTLKQQIENADVIFTATASQQPIITNELLQGVSTKNKLFIDLSLPRNIASDLIATVIDIDKLTDTNQQQKQQYIALAESVINETITEYSEWLARYELAQNVKSHIAESIFDNGLDDDESSAPSKFVDRIASKHLRHFQKGKQSRNLAA